MHPAPPPPAHPTSTPAGDAGAAALAAVSQAAAEGRIDDARRALHAAASRLAEADADGRRLLRSWQLKLAPWWWQPQVGGRVQLRRTQADDADFYAAAFQTPGFGRRYNRQSSWSGDLGRALARAGTLPPLELGALHWIVCDADGTRLGLASLTSISLGNAKAEFSIGFPQPPAPLQAVLATLLAYDLAFFKLRLNKLYTYVYTDNLPALNNSLRVGLRQEGLLKEHFHLPPGEFVDVYAMGLTRTQLLQDARLKSMARRRLGLHWPD
jgi:hypothetical protein